MYIYRCIYISIYPCIYIYLPVHICIYIYLPVIEAEEALELFETCDLSNLIHAAKITRLGEEHKQKAQAYLTKVKGEVDKQKRERHTCTKSGGKHLSAAIDNQKRQTDDQYCQRSGYC